MSSEDDFFYENEFYRKYGGFLDTSDEEMEDNCKESEPTVLKEIVVMSATVNDLYEIFFGIERDKDKPVFWRDNETEYCLFWDETLGEQEQILNRTEGLPRIFIYDWRDAEGKQKDKDFPYFLDPAGEIILLQEPEGLHIRFDVMYSRPNFSLISFVENRINRINLDKEVKVIFSYIDQNDLDQVFRSNSSLLTKSNSDVSFIDSTATPLLQKNKEQKELEPWNEVKVSKKNLEILNLWKEGYTNSEIGKKFHPDLAARTVTNIINAMRIKYGDIIVPRRKPK